MSRAHGRSRVVIVAMPRAASPNEMTPDVGVFSSPLKRRAQRAALSSWDGVAAVAVASTKAARNRAGSRAVACRAPR